MAENETNRKDANEILFRAILSLETVQECHEFFEDLCTFKEVADMVQRLQAAKMLLNGDTYDLVAKEMGISTATISRISRCIRYGAGGYKKVLSRIEEQPESGI